MQIFDAAGLSDSDLGQILSFLRSGGVIGFPTDTAYGLGADAYNESALRRIFEIKGRPESKPILLLVNSLGMAEQIVDVSEIARILAARFWPGPLTMVLRASKDVPRLITAGTGNVGIRWPKAPFAARLVTSFGGPVTATSANKSGMESAVTAQEVVSQLGGTLEILVDGGKLPEAGGSTVLDLVSDPPLLLREGPVSFDELNPFFRGNLLRNQVGD